MTTRAGRLLAAIGIASVVSVVPASAADRFVAPAGSDAANTCLSSLAPCATIVAAVAQAASGDHVRVAGGVYRGSVDLDTSTVLTIEGGWDASFTTRDPAIMPTTVKAVGQVPTISVTAGAGTTIDLTLDGLIISRGFDGGLAAHATGGGAFDVTVQGCTVTRNRTGIVLQSDSFSSFTFQIADSSVRSNRGSGISMQGNCDGVLTDTIVEGNRPLGGLGIYTFNDASLAITGCTVRRNVDRFGGGSGGAGGAHFLTVGHTTLTIDRSTFTGNRARFVPGAVSFDAGGGGAVLDVAVTNSVFDDNRTGRATQGTIAVITGQVDLSLTNDTVVGNRGGGVSLGTLFGPVFSNPTVAATLRNTILWDNDAASEADLRVTQGTNPITVDLDHDIVGVTTSNGTINDLGGNLSVDPLFVGPDDVHLTAASPAVDAGTCTGAPATDFEGDPRPSGPGCDIGADERTP